MVTSPPACGKTHISKQLARALGHVVYLDKDTLIVLSKQIFVAANEPYDRSSDFFEKYIRDYEYKAVIALALEALDYDDTVLINAPFTREVRDIGYMNELKRQLEKKGAELIVIWVRTDPEVCHQRMIRRNSARDTWKLAHWDEYLSRLNFDIPKQLSGEDAPCSLMVFDNSSAQEFAQSMRRVLKVLKPPYGKRQ